MARGKQSIRGGKKIFVAKKEGERKRKNLLGGKKYERERSRNRERERERPFYISIY